MEFSREQKIIQKVMSKAWDDANFMEELIANPLVAINKLTGETITIPEGKVLKVFDQTNPDVICFNIPQKPSLDDVELTAEELESVTGGFWCPKKLLPYWCKPSPSGESPVIFETLKS